MEEYYRKAEIQLQVTIDIVIGVILVAAIIYIIQRTEECIFQPETYRCMNQAGI